MQEAYAEEVSSAGLWAGDARFPQAAFYSYAYPEPPGFSSAAVRPSAARYAPALGEFLLPGFRSYWGSQSPLVPY